jgi:ubiquitin-conjugating enzyme E2 O
MLRSKKIILLDVFRPTALEDSEVSVYDLKDHPDFQYRPGTVVIRVANFEGEDAVCTAGQVLDNYPEGRVSFYQRR